MPARAKEILSFFSAKRIAIPVIIGLGVATYLLISSLSEPTFIEAKNNKGHYEWIDHNKDGLQEIEEFVKVPAGGGGYNKLTYKEVLSSINWTWYSTFWMFIALLMMATRDIAYMYRIRILTDNQISWRRSFDVIMLWEFASAITPSIVGGSGIALYILNREGISVGRSTAVVMITAFLDELFYILMVPTILLIIGLTNLFPVELQTEIFGVTLGTKGIFVAGYFFILALTGIIIYAVFFNPRGFKWILLTIFKIRFLKKWRYHAIKIGDDIIITSRELKNKPFNFWLRAFLATFFSWTARYWVVNFLILAFTTVLAYDHLLIYARQLVMWIIMLISPTPGSSGVAEFMFSGFFKEFIPFGLAAGLAVIWRLASFYPYLFIGAAILPVWFRRVYKKK
ncbi:MAG: lysylphosphatidylglycerol synthase transmembrane domain-containing protein [Bacteroidota bacterium]